MRDFDLTPMWRSTIGFDRLFDLIDDSLPVAGPGQLSALQHRTRR